MVKLLILNGIVFFMIVGSACKQKLDPTAESLQIAKDSLTSNVSSITGIKEFGLLKKAEDSGYPFMTLTIEFPERKTTESFTINLESVANVDLAKMSKAVGHYIAFEYNSILSNMLYDLTLDDQSLLGEVATSSDDEIRTITGKLSGAEEVTAGDLPGMLAITSDNNVTEKFDFFITPEIVNANGKTVTGYFHTRTSNIILALEVK